MRDSDDSTVIHAKGEICRGTNTSMGGVQGGMRRGRKATCPICGRRIGMRPGRAGRLYAHNAKEVVPE